MEQDEKEFLSAFLAFIVTPEGIFTLIGILFIGLSYITFAHLICKAKTPSTINQKENESY